METEPRRLIVDGMNVVGARPTGWWRDRDGAARELVARLQRFAEARRFEVTVVLDGRPLDDLPEGVHGGVRVCYAERRGRDAGDDRVVALVTEDAQPASLEVVTSDRGLAERVRALGASVRGATSLLEELEAAER